MWILDLPMGIGQWHSQHTYTLAPRDKAKIQIIIINVDENNVSTI